MDAHANFAYSTVSTAPSPATSGTSLVVAGGTWPAVPFNATVHAAGATEAQIASGGEIIRVTANSSGTFTIARATEGPNAARTVVVGDIIKAGVTAKTLTDIEQTSLFPIWEPASGNVVGLPYYGTNVGSQTKLLTNSLVYYLPLIITNSPTITAISARVNTAGSAGAVLRMGVFSDSAGQPATLLLDAGTVAATSSTTTVTISSLSLPLTPGLYWVAIVSQGAPATAPTMIGNSNCFAMTVASSLTNFITVASIAAAYSQSGVSGAFSNAAQNGALSNTNASFPLLAVTF